MRSCGGESSPALFAMSTHVGRTNVPLGLVTISYDVLQHARVSLSHYSCIIRLPWRNRPAQLGAIAAHVTYKVGYNICNGWQVKGRRGPGRSNRLVMITLRHGSCLLSTASAQARVLRFSGLAASRVSQGRSCHNTVRPRQDIATTSRYCYMLHTFLHLRISNTHSSLSSKLSKPGRGAA